MAVMTRASLLGLILSLSVTVAGCGGGGGGGGSDAPATPTSPTPTPVLQATAITSANVDQVSGNAMLAADSATSAAQSSLAFISSANNPAIGARVPGAAAVVLREYQRWQSIRRRPTEAQISAVINPTTETCSGGGNLSYSGSEADATAYSVGDIYSVNFNNCREGSTVITGGLGLQVTASSSDTLGFKVSFSKLSSNVGSTTAILDGSANANILVTDSVTTVTFSAPSLSSSTDSGSKKTSANLSNSSSVVQFNSTTGASSYTLTQDFSITSNGSTYIGSMKTLSDVSVSASGILAAGKIRVTGNKSAVDLSFLGSDQVKLELDSNLDGIIDSTKTVQLSAIKLL